ncbi:MAG: hypothetical protein ACYDAK_06765 [Candidatus Limnocylindrales bacterium]
MRLKHPRNAIGVGLVFVAIGVAYYLLSRDAGGTTTLVFLGIAMSIAAYALVVGTPDDL